MKTISNELIPISPALAQSYLLKNTYIGQRGIKPKKIADYARDMTDGVFQLSIITMAKTPTSGFEIIDGQNRLLAVMESGATVDMVVSKIECEDAFELSTLWKKYDGGAIRTLTDMSESESHMMGLNWKAGVATLISGAAAFLENKTTLSKSEKSELIRKYVDEGTFVNSIVGSSGGNHQYLRRIVVVAAMISTFQKDPEDAKKFWTSVKTGHMLHEKSPVLLLRNFLSSFSMAMNRMAITTSKKNISTKEIYAKCIIAWNHYRRNNKVKFLSYMKTKDMPKAA